MRINLLFPYNTCAGAFRSTYELANNMAAKGEDVEIYFPFFPHLRGAGLLSIKGFRLLVRGLARSLVRWSRVSWFDVQVPLKMVPVISDQRFHTISQHTPLTYFEHPKSRILIVYEVFPAGRSIPYLVLI